MKTSAIFFGGAALAAIVAIHLTPACGTTSEQRKAGARTALSVASESCDVVVVLEPDAEGVCVSLERLETLAQVVLKSHPVSIELEDDPPRIELSRSVVSPAVSVVSSGHAPLEPRNRKD